jgi:hypothetical protein
MAKPPNYTASTATRVPKWMSFDINWLRGRERGGRWLKTTALAVFEHGAMKVVKQGGPAVADHYGWL